MFLCFLGRWVNLFIQPFCLMTSYLFKFPLKITPASFSLDSYRGSWANIVFQILKGNEPIFGMASLGADCSGTGRGLQATKKGHFYVRTKLLRPAHLHLQRPPYFPLEYSSPTYKGGGGGGGENAVAMIVLTQKCSEVKVLILISQSLHSHPLHTCGCSFALREKASIVQFGAEHVLL